MKKDTRRTLIAVASAVAVFVAAYACLLMYSGTSTPLYTIESGSMMHSERSHLGIIDTGDMVVVRDPSKANVVTYLEGSCSGYSMFGDYGDVIIYKNAAGRTIIHRAMLHLDWNGDDGTWTVKGFTEYTGNVNITGGSISADGVADGGTLVFEDIHHADGLPLKVDLDSLVRTSGYITMGDANNLTDQETGISMNRTVNAEMISAIAVLEIPWLGCIKLFVSGNNADKIPTNSVWSLIITISLMVAAVAAVTVVHDRIRKR